MDLNKRVAEHLAIDKSIVDQVIHDYWKTLKSYTYEPHKILGGVVIGSVLRLKVRYKQVKRYAYQYANSEFYNYRNLSKYYHQICFNIEHASRKTPNQIAETKRLNTYYENLFNNGDTKE